MFHMSNIVNGYYYRFLFISDFDNKYLLYCLGIVMLVDACITGSANIVDISGSTTVIALGFDFQFTLIKYQAMSITWRLSMAVFIYLSHKICFLLWNCWMDNDNIWPQSILWNLLAILSISYSSRENYRVKQK